MSSRIEKLNKSWRSFTSRIRVNEQKGEIGGDRVQSMFRNGFEKPPANLDTYRKYYEDDGTVGVSIDSLSEMTCGNGIFLTVDDEDYTPQKDALIECEELMERIKFDEQQLNVDKCLNVFGYCPVERVIRRGPPGGLTDILILEPKTVEYKRATTGGKFIGFQQDNGGLKKTAFTPDEMIWYTNNQLGNSKGALYGISKIRRALPLLAIRDKVIENINGIMSAQARPPTIWKVPRKDDADTLKVLLNEARDAAEDLVVYPKDAVEHDTVKIDSRAAYWEYVEYIDGLIFQALHSPLVNYIGNANLASSDNVMEAIERHVIGRQRYLKRVAESEILAFHLRKKGYLDDPKVKVPSLNFGSPKTGLEDIAIENVINAGFAAGYIDAGRFDHIMKQLGINLPDLAAPQVNTQSANPQPANADGKQVNVAIGKGGNVEYRIQRVNRTD